VSAAALPLVPPPALVRRVRAHRVDHSGSRRRARTSLWPAATASLRTRSLLGSKAWFADFGAVRIGGRRDFFTLEAQNGANWVGAPQFGVPPAPVASVAKVGTRAALILVTPGRVIVVWNPDGHGTFVSIRLAGCSRAAVTEAALAVAGSWS
jgi:hypothetical protein